MFPFDPPENIRKPKVFWCFQGDQRRTLGRKELITSSEMQKVNNQVLEEFLIYVFILRNLTINILSFRTNQTF